MLSISSDWLEPCIKNLLFTPSIFYPNVKHTHALILSTHLIHAGTRHSYSHINADKTITHYTNKSSFAGLVILLITGRWLAASCEASLMPPRCARSLKARKLILTAENKSLITKVRVKYLRYKLQVAEPHAFPNYCSG